MDVAEAVFAVVLVYVAIGVLFGVAFVLVGARRIDPAARASGLGFKLTVFPGVAALWPLLALKWATHHENRSDDDRASANPA